MANLFPGGAVVESDEPVSTETPSNALMHGLLSGGANYLDTLQQTAKQGAMALSLPSIVASRAMGASPEQTPGAGLLRAGITPTRPIAQFGVDQGMKLAPENEANRPYFTGGEYLAPTLLTAPLTAGTMPGSFAPNMGRELLSGASAATGAAIGEQKGGATGKLIGGLVGGLAPTAAAAGARGIMRGGEAGRQRVAQAINDYRRVGVTPSAAEVGTLPAKLADRVSSLIPGGNLVAHSKASTKAAQLGDTVGKIADDLSPGSDPHVAGIALEHGLGKSSHGFVTRFTTKANTLYNKADQYIRPDAPVRMTNTQQALDAMASKHDDVKEVLKVFRSDKIGKAQDAVEEALEAGQGAVSYDGLKAIRSSVGEKLTGTALVDDFSKGQLKSLYAALSRDMEEAAKLSGPNAVKAVSRANAFYKAGLKRIEDRIEPLLRQKTPEKIYKALLTSGNEGPTTIRAIKKSVNPEDWKIVSSVAMKRLGKAVASQQDDVGGKWSASTFLSNWNKVHPDARRMLLPGQPGRDLETVAKVASNIRDVQQLIPNPSGTAAAGISGAAAAAAYGFGYVPMALKLAVGSAGTQWLLHSPKFIGWLAKSTRIPTAQLQSHVAQLDKMKGEPIAAELKAAIFGEAE